MTSLRIKYLLVFILLVFFLSGCNNDETQKLINSSISTGNLLSKYYDNLIRYTLETWEMEAF
jgi:hypothetical protein